VLVFYANKDFFSLLKKAEQHLMDIYLISPFATPIIRFAYQYLQTHDPGPADLLYVKHHGLLSLLHLRICDLSLKSYIPKSKE